MLKMGCEGKKAFTLFVNQNKKTKDLVKSLVVSISFKNNFKETQQQQIKH